MNGTAIVIDQNFVIALVMTVLGIILFEVAPPADTTTQDRAKHAVLGLAAFFLLWLVQSATGTFTIDAVAAFAFFSAGIAPNEILDLYQKLTKPAPTPTP